MKKRTFKKPVTRKKQTAGKPAGKVRIKMPKSYKIGICIILILISWSLNTKWYITGKNISVVTCGFKIASIDGKVTTEQALEKLLDRGEED